MLDYFDGSELAAGQAHAAADTLLGVNDERFADFTCDCFGRAAAGACGATLTEHRIDAVGQQGLALVGAADVIPDVLLVFVAEVREGGEHGVGGCLTQAAESGVLDNLGKVLEFVEIFHGAAALGAKGPRSVTFTTTILLFLRLVTFSNVPKG